MSLDDKLDEAAFPTKDVTLCISGDLATAREKLLEEIGSRSKRGDRLAGDPGIGALRKELKELEEKIRAKSITIRLTGLGFTKYQEARLANPPRKGVNESFNPLTFFLDVSIRSGQYVEGDEVSPITPKQWERIKAGLTDAEHDKLAAAVIAVNRFDGLKGISFLGNGSGEIPSSSETSDSPETSG